MSIGSANPGFIIFIPMANLKQNDSVLPWTEGFLELEGEEDAQQLQQIVRDTFASSESNLYAVSPEMSHVSKKFAVSGDSTAQPRPPSAGKTAQPEMPSSPAADQDSAKPAADKLTDKTTK